jgi:putative transposase
MPRLARLTIPGELHFVVQRASSGRRIFVDDVDRATYVEALREAATTGRVAIHAYVMLDDEVQWLVTPDDAPSLGLAVQAVGRRFVAALNRRHGGRGTCWEGRFRSAVVDGRAHALDLIVLLEQEPVIRGLAHGAKDWPWSSAAHHLGGSRVLWLREHPALWGLGNTPFEREAAYARRLTQPVDPAFRAAVHRAANRGWAFGEDAFLHRLMQAPLPRSPRPKSRGRPRALI